MLLCRSNVSEEVWGVGMLFDCLRGSSCASREEVFLRSSECSSARNRFLELNRKRFTRYSRRAPWHVQRGTQPRLRRTSAQLRCAWGRSVLRKWRFPSENRLISLYFGACGGHSAQLTKFCVAHCQRQLIYPQEFTNPIDGQISNMAAILSCDTHTYTLQNFIY